MAIEITIVAVVTFQRARCSTQLFMNESNRRPLQRVASL